MNLFFYGSDSLIRSFINTTVIRKAERFFSQFPYSITNVPTINLVALNILGDLAEFLINTYFHIKEEDSEDHYDNIISKKYLANTLLNVIARTAIGAGIFAATAFVAGSSILPAITLGAATGALLYLINKVSVYSLALLKMIASISLSLTSTVVKNLKIGIEGMYEFLAEKLIVSIPLQTKLELNGVCTFFCSAHQLFEIKKN